MGGEKRQMITEGAEDFDRVVDALGAKARRQVLVELLDHNPLTYGEESAGNGAGEYADTELQMVHVHLPKLDDMGYVSWNRDAGTVVRGAQWEEIEPVIRLLRDHGAQLPSDVF